MTDWGSHGAGSPHETETPILAWGAGIKLPQKSPHSRNPQTVNWGLQTLQRNDINQTDVAPLISSLLGVAVPQNSVGKLPRGLLKMHPSMVLQAAVANVRQIHQQMESFREKFEQAVFHTNFDKIDQAILDGYLEKAQKYGKQNRYEMAFEVLDKTFDLCSEGLTYYQRYHRFSLYLTMTVSYVGFAVLLAVRLLKNYTPFFNRKQRSSFGDTCLVIVTMLSSFGAFVIVMIQNLPLQFLLYFGSPIAVWHLVISDLTALRMPASISTDHSLIALCLQAFVLPAMVLECLIMAFFDRRFLSLAIMTNMAWKLVTKSKSSRPLKAAWVILSAVLSVFSFQPSVGNEKSPVFPMTAGLISALTALILSSKSSKANNLLTIYSVLGLIGSGGLVYVSDIQAYASTCHVLAWTLFLSALPVSMFFSPTTASTRLLSLTAALQTMYILLSVTYEGLFSFCLLATLWTWLKMNTSASLQADMATTTAERNWISLQDVATALDLVFFAIVSFFGVGNIASLNSFNPKSIQTLVSVFNPFLMGSLLLLKVLIPFLMVALFVSVSRKLNRSSNMAMFLMVLLMSDFMALQLFFLVTDQGSWQEIGTSLSHYVIAQATVIFLQVFTVAADWLLTWKALFAKHDELSDTCESNLPLKSHFKQF